MNSSKLNLYYKELRNSLKYLSNSLIIMNSLVVNPIDVAT